MNAKPVSQVPQLRQNESPLSAARELSLLDDPKQVVYQLRRRWLAAIARRTLIFVGIPTLLAVIYYGFLASNQYESIAVLTVQQSESTIVARSDSLLSSGAAGVNSGRELLAMREYILSRAMFGLLDKSVGLFSHYSSASRDFISRLSPRADHEQAFVFYLKHVQAEYDSASATLTLRAQAFEPDLAQKLADAIVANTETKLNEIADKTHAAVLHNAELHLEHAEKRLVAAKQQSVLERTGSNLGVSSRPNENPATAKSADGAAPLGVSEAAGLGESKRAELELAFSEKAYDASITMLAELSARDIRRRPVLITVVKPSLSDHSTQPRRAVAIFTVFIFSLLALGIGALTVAAVREHIQL